MNQKKLWFSFFSFIAICLLVQLLGSTWTKETVSTWYPTLIKPTWAPPNWIFGPVWSILYIMIAISGWLIYRSNSSYKRTRALLLYGIQLAFNFIWSFLFFALQSPLLGLVDIVLLCVFIILTILYTWPVKPLASLLLIPYLIWVAYAAALNATIWNLNQ